MSAPIEERWSNGLARTCRCAANARCGGGALGGLPPQARHRADDLAVMRRIENCISNFRSTARGE